MAGCGCGALLGAAFVAAMIFAVLEDPDFFRREFATETAFTPERAKAARDSLSSLDMGAVARAPARDGYTLPPRGRANGAATAVLVWTDSAFVHGIIAFGDTFPDGDRARRRWVAAAAWDVVDSLRAAALNRWDLDAALPGEEDRALWPTGVLPTTRAVLARARLAEVRGEAAEADTLVRAVVTVGRHLQRDYRLSHVLLGARIEWEAFHVLAGVEAQGGRRVATPATVAALARAEVAARAAERAYRLITVAGALADNCPDLLGVARDRAVPLPLRHAAVWAIGYGWALAPGEQTSVDSRRGHALADLAEGDVPPQLRRAVALGRQAVELSLFRRFDLMTRVQAARAAWRLAG